MRFTGILFRILNFLSSEIDSNRHPSTKFNGVDGDGVSTTWTFIVLLPVHNPVSTRRRFDVYTTLFGRQQHYYNIKTTSCTYWKSNEFWTYQVVESPFAVFKMTNQSRFLLFLDVYWKAELHVQEVKHRSFLCLLRSTSNLFDTAVRSIVFEKKYWSSTFCSHAIRFWRFESKLISITIKSRKRAGDISGRADTGIY